MFLTFGYFLLPVIMIIHGTLLYDDNPSLDKKFGYRSKNALYNEETYAFANKAVYEYFIRLNYTSLFITIAYCIVYQTFGRQLHLVYQVLFFVSLTAIQLLGCALPFRFVERDLKIKFADYYEDPEIREGFSSSLNKNINTFEKEKDID